MRQLHDPALLKRYIEQHHLQDSFSMDLAQVATLVSYEADELISHIGEFYDRFLILVEGECFAYVLMGADKIHCECHYRETSIMGLVSILWNEPVINNVRAITPCICLSIPADRYREQLLNDVKFLRHATSYLAAHIRKSAAHFEPLEIRLAAFILEMAKNQVFHYNLTLCADLLDTSYRHLLRTLHVFCDMNILEKRGKGHYGIVDRAQLEQLQAGGSIHAP